MESRNLGNWILKNEIRKKIGTKLIAFAGSVTVIKSGTAVIGNFRRLCPVYSVGSVTLFTPNCDRYSLEKPLGQITMF